MNTVSSRASAMALLTSVLGADAIQPQGKRLDPMPRGPMPKKVRITAGPPKPRVKLTSLVSVCRGGSHGIFQSDVGLVRKPFDAETIHWTQEVAQQSAA